MTLKSFMQKASEQEIQPKIWVEEARYAEALDRLEEAGDDQALRRKAQIEVNRHEKRVRALRRGVCCHCDLPALEGRVYCTNHYVRVLLHKAARVSTSATLEAAAPAFKVDDAAVAWVMEMFQQQQGRCYLSGRELVIGKNAVLDHVYARSLHRKRSLAGGINNLKWADDDVNRAKSDLTPDEFVDLCHEVVRRNGEDARFGNQKRHWGNPRSVRLEIPERGSAYLRATFPPKPGSMRARAHQQRLNLGFRCETAEQRRKALALRAKVEHELLTRVFAWEDWL